MCVCTSVYICILGVLISHEKVDPIRISIHGHATIQEKMHVDKKRFSTIRFDAMRFNAIRCSSIIENTEL